MKYYFIAFFITFILLYSPTWAQDRKPTSEAYALLQQAKKKMEDGDYSQANLIFRRMLKLNSILPTEMSYLFAETLYKVGQYENSMSFLKRYQDITDRSSDYYLLSLDLEKELMIKLQEIRHCGLCDLHGYRLAPCELCHQTGKTQQTCHLCRGKGIIACPVCAGDGVIISYDQFNTKQYRSCERCQAKGVVTCHVCHGEKEVTSACPQCGGNGALATQQLCDHVAHGD